MPLTPLGLPPVAPTACLEEIAASPAVQLFVDSARAVRPAFALTPTVAANVAALRHRLGGLSLAIELAAAEVRVLSAASLLEHLDDVLAEGGARDLPPRQQTMGSTLDWSYHLLDEGARQLLARLSTISGWFGLAAVSAATPGGQGRPKVLAGLDTLVEHSLVEVVDDDQGE